MHWRHRLTHSAASGAVKAAATCASGWKNSCEVRPRVGEGGGGIDQKCLWNPSASCRQENRLLFGLFGCRKSCVLCPPAGRAPLRSSFAFRWWRRWIRCDPMNETKVAAVGRRRGKNGANKSGRYVDDKWRAASWRSSWQPQRQTLRDAVLIRRQLARPFRNEPIRLQSRVARAQIRLFWNIWWTRREVPPRAAWRHQLLPEVATISSEASFHSALGQGLLTFLKKKEKKKKR